MKTPKNGTLTNEVTEEEASAYNPVCDELPCTADDFRLYLLGTPAHPWNKAATSLFVESFCEKFTTYDRDEVEERFKAHLAGVIRKYKSQEAFKDDPGAREESKKTNRRNSRKAAVSQFSRKRIRDIDPDYAQLLADRKRTVNNSESLKKHAGVIDSLGTQGMSSDETSVEGGVRVYRIRKLPWRSAELGHFLHTIDRVTEDIRDRNAPRGFAGALRLSGGNATHGRKPPKRLPVNFFD